MAKTEFRKKLEQYSKEYVAMCESHKECSGCPYKDADCCFVKFLFDRENMDIEEIDTSLYYDGFDDGYKAHKELTELEKNRWIPVAERLPEEKENPITMDFYEYPVTYKVGDITDVRYRKFGRGHWWCGLNNCDEYVIAWMPLPEPYKEEGAE